jgi:hypothetical protein
VWNILAITVNKKYGWKKESIKLLGPYRDHPPDILPFYILLFINQEQFELITPATTDTQL